MREKRKEEEEGGRRKKKGREGEGEGEGEKGGLVFGFWILNFGTEGVKEEREKGLGRRENK